MEVVGCEVIVGHTSVIHFVSGKIGSYDWSIYDTTTIGGAAHHGTSRFVCSSCLSLECNDFCVSSGHFGVVRKRLVE